MMKAPAKQVRTLSTYREPNWHYAVSAFLVSAGLFGITLVHQARLWNEARESASAVLGAVRPRAGTVRVKPEGSLAWLDLAERERSVVEGDSIFTGEGGRAELSFDRAGRIQIQPNSLVVVHRPSHVGSKGFRGFLKGLFAERAPERLAVVRGSIDVSLPKRSNLELEVSGRLLDVAAPTGAANFALKLDPVNPPSIQASNAADLRLTELRGGTPAAAPFHLKAGGAASVGAAGVSLEGEGYFYHPYRPKEGESVLLGGARGKTVRFRWDWRPPRLDFEGGARLEIEGGQSRVLSIGARDRRAEVALGGGSYRWRAVREVSAGKWESSRWTRFTVELVSAPQGTGPVDGFVAPTRSEFSKAQVAFSWSPPGPGMKVQLEITSPGTRRMLLEGAGDGVEASLAPGEYRWRIRKKSISTGKASEWGPARSLTVSKQAISQAKAAAAVISPVAVASETPAARKLFAHWRIPAPVSSAAPAATSASPSSPRAKPVPRGQSAQASKVPAPAALSSQAAVGTGRFKPDWITPELSVRLRWKAAAGAKRFKVRLLSVTDAELGESESAESELEMRLESYPEGGLRAEITSLGANGAVLGSLTTPVAIQGQPAALIQPERGAAFAPGRKVFMSWARIPFADEYRLQVAQDPRFSTLVHEARSAKNAAFYAPSDPGIYYWRVIGTVKSRSGEWSEVGTFEIR